MLDKAPLLENACLVVTGCDVHLERAGEYLIKGSVVEPENWFAETKALVFSPDTNNLLRRNIIAAPALVECGKCGAVPVRILSAEPVTLYKGTRLGTVETCPTTAAVNSIGIGDPWIQKTGDPLRLFQNQLDKMPPKYAEIMKPILSEFSDVFSVTKMDIGCAVGVEHRIHTGEAPPIAVNYRRVPLALEGKVDELVEKLLEQNIIRQSQSPWNAPIVVVRKKNGDIRMCLDYRRLNAVTIRPVFPIPDSVQLFDTLEGSKYFSSLDLSQGYYQVPMHKDDMKKTAFTTRQGQFEFTRMPFGLCSAPATFQRLMHSILRNENWKQCLIYLDDVLIFARTLEEHSYRLRIVLQRFREAGLKLSPEKCHFLKTEVEYLGHVIKEDGIKPSTTKIDKVKNWPTPTNAEQLRTFIGLCGYYRRHIHHYADIVAPLERLCIATWTQKGKDVRKAPFEWNETHTAAFEQLKAALTTAPVLAFPTAHGIYILDTDASYDTVGAVLSQVQDGVERVISYASHKLSKAEKHYCVTRKELLAVYKYVKQYSSYLYGKQFRIRTDHKALTWLLNWAKPSTTQYCSWIAELSEYDMKIEHRPGKQHGNADALSRLPPCEQCDIPHEDPKKKRNVKNINETEAPRCRQIFNSPSRQDNDEVISRVLQLLKSGNLANNHPKELDWTSRETKLLWAKRQKLRIRGDVLYYLASDNIYKWIVPNEERKRLIFSVHKGCGHIGVTRTTKMIKENYYWPDMDFFIRTLLNTCKSCRERKNAGARNLPPPQASVTSYPFEKIALDITGPLRPCKNGERYILGIVDYFSKFPMLIPLHNVESKTVARAVFNNWICLFGAPVSIHTDRGTAFESALFHELCLIAGVSKTKTAPYYPQSDGLIERLFSTTKDMIFATTRDASMDWKDSLPIISLGLRSSIQRATKTTPFEVLFGCSMRTPVHWTYPTYKGSGNRKTSQEDTQLITNEYILDLQRRLKLIHSRIASSNHNRDRRDEKTVVIWPIGTYVMARILPKTRGIDQPRYIGPYRIVKLLGPSTYRLQHCKRGDLIDRNIHHIKKFTPEMSVKSGGESMKVSPQSVTRKRRDINPPQRFGYNSS